MDENVLKAMFEASEHNQQNGGGGAAGDSKFTPQEASRFKKAFEDPEFRKMFSEYMDELQDPKHREETEAYISQLEGEQKVPEGKELIRPQAGFVAKTHKIKEGGKDVKEKIFINIVKCDKIAQPTKTTTEKGDCWSVPYSSGPPHMEKDKKGENSACFDCCFHPEALRLSELNADFKSLLVTTAMDGVEALYLRQEQDVKLDRQFHVVKGVSYKEGMVPTMMIALANKNAWNEKTSTKKTGENAKDSKSLNIAKATETTTPPIPPLVDAKQKSEGTPKKPASAIKKGFLNSSKSSIYEDKIPTIRPKVVAPPPPAELTEEDKNKQVDQLIKEMEKAAIQSQEPPKINTRDPTESSDSLKAVSTKLKPKVEEVQPASNEDRKPSVPLVVCKHREAMSMGDFEGMKSQQVGSRRPTELIYEINLPLVTTPSKIILDVAEKKIMLSYMDIYKLDMELPFKVHDKKGKASYDKAKKVLKVTLPVEQAEMVPVVSSQPVSSTIEEVVTTKIDSPVRAQPPATAATTKEKHNRWVEDSSIGKVAAVETEKDKTDQMTESQRLFLEVQQQAENARKKYLDEQQQKTVSAPVPVRKPVKKTVTNSIVPSVNDSKPFIAATNFSGAKSGYVFKRGDEGVGYYLDIRSDSKSNPSLETQSPIPDATPPETSPSKSKQQTNNLEEEVVTVPFVDIPFSVKTNQATVSFLFQVKNIVAESVKIDIQAFSFTIQFQTTDDVNIHYGMMFTLDEQACEGGLDVVKFKYDVASKNMALVISKKDRTADWNDDDSNLNWLTSSVLQRTEKSVLCEETKSIDPPKSPKVVQDVLATNALKSIISTMKFSTDFVSELD